MCHVFVLVFFVSWSKFGTRLAFVLVLVEKSCSLGCFHVCDTIECQWIGMVFEIYKSSIKNYRSNYGFKKKNKNISNTTNKVIRNIIFEKKIWKKNRMIIELLLELL